MWGLSAGYAVCPWWPEADALVEPGRLLQLREAGTVTQPRGRYRDDPKCRRDDHQPRCGKSRPPQGCASFPHGWIVSQNDRFGREATTRTDTLGRPTRGNLGNLKRIATSTSIHPRAAIVVLLLAVTVFLFGCGHSSGGTTAAGTQSGNQTPESVARAFVQAVVDREPTACRMMTPQQRKFAGTQAQTSSCLQAVASQRFLARAFGVRDGEKITAGVTRAKVLRSSGRARVIFCAGDVVNITLKLAERPTKGFLVDGVGSGRSYNEFRSGRQTPIKCST